MARFSVMVERGLKTSTDLLDMLGVSAEQFKQASPEERFKLLAEAISQIEDPTLRAGIALNVFGRSGRELLPMLAARFDKYAIIRSLSHGNASHDSTAMLTGFAVCF